MEFSKYDFSSKNGNSARKKFKTDSPTPSSPSIQRIQPYATSASSQHPGFSNKSCALNGVEESIKKQRHNLPVYRSRCRIINIIKENPSVILIGETASGKTTQVPQFILESAISRGKMIAITQPRRVAAITVAQRVANERNCDLGETVGYAVRFEDVCSPKTKLKFLTDGLLLREAMLDPLLKSYSVVILDEAHERTIATDVLFGIVKGAQQKRSQLGNPLKVVIMSATMDVDLMRTYFSFGKKVAPVVWVEGRTHQVEIRQTVESQEDYLMTCLNTLFMIHRDTPLREGVLMFLTGQEEIDAMAANVPGIVRELNMKPMSIFPLYSALPQDQQALAFRPAIFGCRKVVLSTNIAETSVTIAGIRHVIDSGMVKARTHLPGTGLDVLKVQQVSQAQAWQRTGRAGREASGTCYRCYTKKEFNKMKTTSEPEILRVNLSSVILQLLTIGISKVSEFDFLDKPSKQGLEDATDQLKSLGAVKTVPASQELHLTVLGRKMALFPLDARLSKVLLSSVDMGCRDEILSLVALLSGEGALLTSSSKRAESQAAQAKFRSQYGDHETLLNIYRAFSASKQKKLFCLESQLNLRALLQAGKVREQLTELCERAGLPPSTCGSDLAVVRRCLLSGLFSNIATHQRDKIYFTVSKQHVVTLHPSSVLFSLSPPPSCLLYSELVHTARNYMRQVSVVDPAWVAELHPEIARRLPGNS